MRVASPVPEEMTFSPKVCTVSPASGEPMTKAQRASRSAASWSRGVVVGEVRMSAVSYTHLDVYKRQILVITHIDELRDKFPARIDVEKTAAGSRLSVVTI